MTELCISIRAHHGMCLAFFEGKGYSPEFTAHMGKISELLQGNPRVRLVAEGDVLCEKCPNLQDGLCNTPEQVEGYDRRVLALCGLPERKILPWAEFSRCVAAEILAKGKRAEICGDCPWTEICKAKEGTFLR